MSVELVKRSLEKSTIQPKLKIALPYIIVAIFVSCIALAVGIFRSEKPSATTGKRPPNVILILADDVGWGDLGSYGHPYSKTPNLDKLASEGTRFEKFYVTGPTCAPSRTGFMTSRSYLSFPEIAGDHGFQGRPTITELLSKNGYITGHFGKWHIGQDSKKGTYGIHDIFTKKTQGTKLEKDALIFDTAKSFITQNKDKPFYMNIWTRAVHAPVESHSMENTPFRDLNVHLDDFKQFMRSRLIRSQDKGVDINAGVANYLYAIHLLDQLIGDLLNHLDSTGISQNTIVVFASDQGPVSMFRGNVKKEDLAGNLMGYTNGLRGGKHTLFEGGVRSPFIIRWPGKVQSGVANSSSIISAMDWLPTVAYVAGIDIDSSQFEGENVADIWKGSNRSRTNPLIWAHHKNKNMFALLQNEWKLVGQDNQKFLFNLSNDPSETLNLYESHEETFKNLLESVTQWQSSVIQNKMGKPVVQEPIKL